MTELFTVVIAVALLCQVYVWVAGRKVASAYFEKHKDEKAKKLSSVQRNRLLMEMPKLCPDDGELVKGAAIVRKVEFIEWALLFSGCFIILYKWFSE